MSSDKELHVFTDGTDTVIAVDSDDATEVLFEHTGDEPSPRVWRQLPDDKPLGVDWEPSGQYVEPVHTVKTCAEWIAQEGRGFLCSTEY